MAPGTGDADQAPKTSENNKASAGPGKTGKGKDISDTSREIDQQHLAELLRESAKLVERGEFGSILYEALQDFRVYYKQKYPKTGGKKKKKQRSDDKKVSRQRSSGSTNKDGERQVSASSRSLETEKSADQEDTKSEAAGDTPGTKEETGDVAGISGDATSKTDLDNPEANSNINNDPPTESKSDPVTIEDGDAPRVNEGTEASKPAAVPVNSSDPPTPSRPARKTTDPVVDSAVPLPQQGGVAPIPVDPRRPVASQSTPQTNNKTGGFGKKFKLGATLKNVKKAALNVTEKITENIDKQVHRNNTNTHREDLEIFNESGIAMAESTGRRTRAGTDDGEFANSDFKSRVIPGVAGASSAGSSTSGAEHDAYSEEFHNNYSYQDNHGRPKSDRNLHPPVNQPRGPSRYGSKAYGQQQPAPPPRYNSQQDYDYESYPQETTSDLGESYASISEIQAQDSFEEADPIMECSAKPMFQRPANQNSPLVVSGWIEQFRRSKMRHVWKEVLASLVEGRKPGEVTTLWIQREIVNPSTGQKELEALHRIPLKLLEEVTFTEHTTDNQFRLKLYNATEDFVFRCVEAPNDALRWVQTLKKHEKLSKGTTSNGSGNISQSNSGEAQQQQAPASTKGMPIRDLRAICHGAGVNTAGMERTQLEAAAEEVQRRGTYFDQRGAATGPTTAPVSGRFNSDPSAQQYASQQQQQQPTPQQYPPVAQEYADHGHTNAPPSRTDSVPPPQEQPQQSQQRMGIKELRAICHGAGINTAGMERRELEAAAKEVQSRGTYMNPPMGMHAPNEGDEARARMEMQQQQQNEEMRRRQEADEQRRQEELRSQRQRQEVEERHRREVEEARRRQAAVEQEKRRRAAEEEQRRRAYEEEQRRRAAEEEARRRAAAEEQRRRQQEAQAAQQRYAQQQAAWHQQQHAEEQRRRAAEQQAAVERQRREEAMRKEQEWATPAPGAYAQQQQQWQQQQRHQGYAPQQQQWQQQPQRPPPQHHPQQAPNTAPPPQPQQQQRQQSGADNKYAKMANQSEDDGQASTTKIKHGILIQWALQPPQLQMLRPIAALITTIHTVFPPALGVSGHDYFQKWKPITREDVAGANGLPEESKIKKSVRKIRFFLHPDKLPHDLDEEQKFTVKMLWDITNDAWEEYQKHKEDLDWVN